jgi:transcriptional regulator with XRE-family HTH domain
MPRTRPLAALERLGTRLRARRLFLQLPLAYTAHEMALSKNMLCDYEHGRGHPPALTLLRIAKVLGTSTSDLLAERNKFHAEDVDRAVRLFADPAIHEVADSMSRMDSASRHAIVLGVRKMERHPVVNVA